jgi:hypothetical protein
MNLALCKCGIDMTEHPHLEPWDDYPTEPIPEDEHAFDAAGTKYPCEKYVNTPEGKYLCPRPMYHEQHDVVCGPLTGKKLW